MAATAAAARAACRSARTAPARARAARAAAARATHGAAARGSSAATARAPVRAQSVAAAAPPAVARGGAARLAERLAQAFPVWVVAGAVVGMAHPPAVTWFAGEAVTRALAVTMLGMGLTIRASDFAAVAQTPSKVVAGAALQYTIMPMLGYAVGKLLALPTPFAVGLILVSCCPGGTASNVVTYIARANVALSVALTTISTAAAVVFTPALTAQLAGALVAVDAPAMLLSTLQVVLAPTAAGLALQRFAPRAVAVATPFSPLVAVVCVALICASIIGQNQAAILTAGGSLLAAVCLLHTAGFALGYATSRLLGFDEATRRTMSIEVGMQNSALGVVLAKAHFSNPLTAVPCAISATMHSVIGSGLAGLWRASPPPGASAGTSGTVVYRFDDDGNMIGACPL